MRLIINAVLPTSSFHLLNANVKYISTHTVDMAGIEYDRFLTELEGFLVGEGQSFSNITHIYCITGPASFTGGRIVTLTLGTIAKVYPITLIGLTLFEYWSILGNEYPMACAANATEYILAATPTSLLELCPIADLDITSLNTWDLQRSRLQEGQSPLHYNEVGVSTDFTPLRNMTASKTLNPLYLKKPNVTLPR